MLCFFFPPIALLCYFHALCNGHIAESYLALFSFLIKCSPSTILKAEKHFNRKTNSQEAAGFTEHWQGSWCSANTKKKEELLLWNAHDLNWRWQDYGCVKQWSGSAKPPEDDMFPTLTALRGQIDVQYKTSSKGKVSWRMFFFLDI